jgi:hypothetical protein
MPCYSTTFNCFIYEYKRFDTAATAAAAAARAVVVAVVAVRFVARAAIEQQIPTM